MSSLPYVTSSGNIDKALNAIKAAAVPERVSQDFVKTILGIKGGSGDQITTFLKKIGFAGTDGTPTDIYKKFRNPTSSGNAVAYAIKQAYKPLFDRNEFLHKLPDDDLLGLIVEETGLAHDSNPVKMIFSSLKHLKTFADFEGTEAVIEKQINAGNSSSKPILMPTKPDTDRHLSKGGLGLNLGYTINLNLPATSDSAVFDAIFRSLKEHLLDGSDG